MAGDHRRAADRQLAFDDVEIGSTDPTSVNPDTDLDVAWLGYVDFGPD
jgi:hypothetical protein